jgi:hypothetical protein
MSEPTRLAGRNRLQRIPIIASITAMLIGCSGSDVAASNAAGNAGIAASSGGAGNGGTPTTNAGTTSMTTGGTTASASTSPSGGANTGGVNSGVGGVATSIGQCPPNAQGTACGSQLRYCLIGSAQTCACTQGSWFCFGGTGGSSS